MLFDLTSSQRLHFKYSLGSFYFGEGFESMTLIKSNGIRFKEIDCLYLPLEPILEIKWQEFSSIPSWSEYRKLITNKRIFTSSKSLISWSIKRHDKFFDLYICTNESVKQEIGKIKISWQIEYLHDLLEIKSVFEDQYSFFKYLIVNNGKALLSRGADKDLNKNLNLDEFSFSSINLKWSRDNLKLLWKLLSSLKTKYSLCSVKIAFLKLLECLSALPYCSDCLEIEDVSISYQTVDVRIQNKIVSQESMNFKNKIKIFKNFKITKQEF